MLSFLAFVVQEKIMLKIASAEFLQGVVDLRQLPKNELREIDRVHWTIKCRQIFSVKQNVQQEEPGAYKYDSGKDTRDQLLHHQQRFLFC